MRVLFTGGGTGGHFFPNIAVIRELKRIAKESHILSLELFYIGPDDFGKEILQEENVAFVRIKSGKIRRYFSLYNLLDSFRTFAAVLQAVWNLFFIMPDIIFSKGGFGAFPVVVAAIVFHIPLIIHESDSIPGKVNIFSTRFAKRIGVAFGGAEKFFPKEKTALIGVPIRKRILGGNKDEAREHFGIMTDLPVVGIIGASQGAQRINEAAIDVLPEITNEFEVIHQTGEQNYKDVMGEARVMLESGFPERYHAFGFLDETRIREFFSASDIIVSRSSGSMIFEIAAWGKPSILIPLGNSAQDHQRKNAYEYAGTGAASVLEESNLTPHLLLAEIKKIIGNPELMRTMGEAAQRFSKIDSAEVIAREIIKLGVHD